MRIPLTALIAVGLFLPALAGAQTAPLSSAACDALASFKAPNVTITLAQVVAQGSFMPPAAGGGGRQGAPAAAGGRQGAPAAVPPAAAAPAAPAAGRGGGGGGIPAVPGRVTLASANLGLGYNGGRPNAQFSELPAFCRVTATLTPSASSDIRSEIWLPMAVWNGNFRGTSPNGTGGNPNYNTLANAVRDGYAAASSDMGHRGNEPMWMRDAEKLTDFGGRAMHETTVLGKALAQALYGRAPQFSYMIECGGGSTAAMAEVQKYPTDYDGVVVGGFAAYWTRQVFGQAWAWQAANLDPASVIPPGKYPVIHNAVLQACDALDGVRDGLLEDPTRCTWDPKVIQCTAGDGPSCLTAPQVTAVQQLYAGPTNPRTGAKIHSPVYRGSELDWAALIGGQAPIANAVMRDFVLADPMWDIRMRPVNFDADVTRADRAELAPINQFNPGISAFVARGGRLILSGGWSNAIVPPGVIMDYYRNVQARIGNASTQQGVRLYMVPGMSECNGGPGTDTFDMLAVMRQWVEQKRAPGPVTASRVENGNVVRTRPLCPFPQVATYTGRGSTDDAANFVCR